MPNGVNSHLSRVTLTLAFTLEVSEKMMDVKIPMLKANSLSLCWLEVWNKQVQHCTSWLQHTWSELQHLPGYCAAFNTRQRLIPPYCLHSHSPHLMFSQADHLTKQSLYLQFLQISQFWEQSCLLNCGNLIVCHTSENDQFFFSLFFSCQLWAVDVSN